MTAIKPLSELVKAEHDVNEALLDAAEAIEEVCRQLCKLEAAGMAEDLGAALRVVTDMHAWSTAHFGWTAEDPS